MYNGDFMKSPRYGSRIRKLYTAAEESKKKLYKCPKCGKVKVKRIGFAIWECKACGAKFAGGAYSLFTPTGEMVLRSIKENKE